MFASPLVLPHILASMYTDFAVSVEHVEEWRAGVDLFQLGRVNKLVSEPWEFPRIKSIHNPLNHPLDPRDAGAIRMICEPYIEFESPIYI